MSSNPNDFAIPSSPLPALFSLIPHIFNSPPNLPSSHTSHHVIFRSKYILPSITKPDLKDDQTDDEDGQEEFEQWQNAELLQWIATKAIGKGDIIGPGNGRDDGDYRTVRGQAMSVERKRRKMAEAGIESIRIVKERGGSDRVEWKVEIDEPEPEPAMGKDAQALMAGLKPVCAEPQQEMQPGAESKVNMNVQTWARIHLESERLSTFNTSNSEPCGLFIVLVWENQPSSKEATREISSESGNWDWKYFDLEDDDSLNGKTGPTWWYPSFETAFFKAKEGKAQESESRSLKNHILSHPISVASAELSSYKDSTKSHCQSRSRNGELSEIRGETMTMTAEDFWAGYSDDEDDDKGDTGKGRKEADDGDDDDSYWSRYDSVQTTFADGDDNGEGRGGEGMDDIRAFGLGSYDETELLNLVSSTISVAAASEAGGGGQLSNLPMELDLDELKEGLPPSVLSSDPSNFRPPATQPRSRFILDNKHNNDNPKPSNELELVKEEKEREHERLRLKHLEKLRLGLEDLDLDLDLDPFMRSRNQTTDDCGVETILKSTKHDGVKEDEDDEDDDDAIRRVVFGTSRPKINHDLIVKDLDQKKRITNGNELKSRLKELYDDWMRNGEDNNDTLCEANEMDGNERVAADERTLGNLQNGSLSLSLSSLSQKRRQEFIDVLTEAIGEIEAEERGLR